MFETPDVKKHITCHYTNTENCALDANQLIGLNSAKGVKQGIQLACIRYPNAQESS